MNNYQEWHMRSAYLLVQGDWKACENVWRKAKTWDATIGQWLVTGPWDLLIWLDARSWHDTYDKVVELRKEKGVKATSTHFVYKGIKNGKWWWQWPAGSWVFLRSSHLNGEMKNLAKWSWATSAASIPGDWDYLLWAGGKNWKQVWDNLWTLNRSGWQTETLVPVRSWWNKDWQKSWWATS